MNEDIRPAALLDKLLEADAKALRAHDQLRDHADQDAVAEAVVSRLRSALERGVSDPETELAIQRLLEICSELTVATTTEAILEALGHDDPGIREAAAEAALQRTYERYAEVARFVEQGNLPPLALQELCFVFVQVGEPSTVSLLSRLLKHQDADVVAAAIEALTEFGDSRATKFISSLTKDPREVTLEHADEEFVATIGELAGEALEELAKN